MFSNQKTLRSVVITASLAVLVSFVGPEELAGQQREANSRPALSSSEIVDRVVSDVTAFKV